MAPAPISWPPSQYWDGDDGSWSSFALRIGSPEQIVRVLPSTAGQETWVVSPQGCRPGEHGNPPYASCNQSRGGLFDTTQSNSWQALGNYSLGLELNLGYDNTAPSGVDTVTLGFDKSIGGPTIDSQVISALATDNYYMGMFGLGHQGTNISNFTEPRASFLTAMHNKNLIPSLSWAYTAGARYRPKSPFGSLTFGGYDRSRFIPNNVSLYLAPDISRDIVVGLQSISSTVTTGDSTTQQQLLPKHISTFIDSTVPYMYLPVEACQEFEKALGLEWDSAMNLYRVNYTLYQSLLKKNLSFTFTIADATAGGATVQIDLPYASFDLEAKYPWQPDTTRYFPLKQAANDSQYTLGRTFLQEAYIIVDYGRSNFSVSQCRFEDGIPSDLVAIPSAIEPPSHLRRNIAIGTSIGTAAFLLLAVLAAIFAIRRLSKTVTIKLTSEATERPMSLREPRELTVDPAQRIDYNSMIGPLHELPDRATAKVGLLNEQAPPRSGNQIEEMPEALPPVLYELRTSHSSHVMVQLRTANSCKVFAPTRIKSWTSFASSDGALGATYVETGTSASAEREEVNMDRASTANSNPVAEIYSLYTRTSLNLNKSLPSTPISESPQVSPVVAKYNDGSPFCRRPQMVKIPACDSGSAFVSPEKLVSTHSATFS